MKLHGDLAHNLEAALASIRRFRGQRVYPETLDYWRELVSHAQATLDRGGLPDAPNVRRIRDALAAELADRS